MLIEFRLPQGAGGITSGLCYQAIKAEIEAWSNRYNVRYTDKVVRYTYRVCFDNDKDYSLFQLTWEPDPNPKTWFYDYRIIKDRERDSNNEI
jgi:hypothetical protein